ncbi:MAG: hypothetical protein ACI94N_000542, partial [Candidatus Arcticimaribacter sp.]
QLMHSSVIIIAIVGFLLVKFVSKVRPYSLFYK